MQPVGKRAVNNVIEALTQTGVLRRPRGAQLEYL